MSVAHGGEGETMSAAPMSKPSGQKMPPLFIIFICCAATNMIYPLVHGGSFEAGIERTYFQGWALLVVWLWPLLYLKFYGFFVDKRSTVEIDPALPLVRAALMYLAAILVTAAAVVFSIVTALVR